MKKYIISLTLFIFSVSHRQAFSYPVNVSNGFPAYQTGFAWQDVFNYIKVSDDPTSMNVEFNALINTHNFFYGITQNTNFGISIPYIDKDVKFTIPEGRFGRGDAGLGDITLLILQDVFQCDLPGRNIHLGILAGPELPTGKDDASDQFGRLDPPLQLGSGSWDGFFAALLTVQDIRWEFDVELDYKLNTKANHFEFGDVFTHKISFSYSVYPWLLNPKKAEESPFDLFAVLELIGNWEDKSQADGFDIDASGGYTLFISPGISLVSDRAVVGAGIQLPVVQDLNGQQPEYDFITTFWFIYTI